MTHNLSLAALKAGYASGDITPKSLILELRQQAIQQADFNAWIHLLSEDELEPYFEKLDGQSPESLPLFGVPFAVKDNIDVAGIPTTAACKEFSFIPEHSSFVVAQLIAAGAVPLGKTNLDQFATGLVGVRSPFGEGKNAFNSDYLSGGSSAGSAISTSLGQVSFALGTDTAGSGRVPAAFNNLVGLKPSKGLLSNSGVVPACKTLDCISIFALNTQDAAEVFNVAATYDPEDEYAKKGVWSNAAPYYSEAETTFTFGVPTELEFDGDTAAENIFNESVSMLIKLGGTKVTIDFKPFSDAAKLLYEGPWVAERQWATRDVNIEHMVPVLQTILGAEPQSAQDAFAAQYALQKLKVVCDSVLAELDFILTPTTPTTYTREAVRNDPVRLNSMLGTYTNFMNLLDYAATAVPTGKLPSGVHWGVTFFGPRDQDIQLLGYAGRLHKAMMNYQGCTDHPIASVTTTPKPAPNQTVNVVVCGAHLSGMPLNWQLTERGGKLVNKTQTAAIYRLFALPDGMRPALVKNETNGESIDVEVWQLPMSEFGSFVAGIPAPLGIGKTLLIDGESYPGFICEEQGAADAQDITEYKSWRAWVTSC